MYKTSDSKDVDDHRQPQDSRWEYQQFRLIPHGPEEQPLPVSGLLRFPQIPAVDQPDLVMLGFHGTSADVGRQIINEQRMIPSTHEYEWLGHGVYFWEDDPVRAWKWAQDRFPGKDLTVVKARILRGTCLITANSAHGVLIKKAEAFLVDREAQEGRLLPLNRGSRSDRDCAVLNFLYENLDTQIDTVRAPFHEGRARYDSSRFQEKDHVQVCVRNPKCIVELSLCDISGLDEDFSL
jgi:hypothetical protein